MKEPVIIDTNVLIAANGRKTHADWKCQLDCIEALEKIKSDKTVCLDSLGKILDEYSRHCNYKGEPGAGDLFFKYIFDNQLVGTRCRIIQITQDPNDNTNFIEFPTHTGLNSFDPSDRKFIAVSIASTTNPPIYNATDSDWEEFKEPINELKILVIQLCPQHANKMSNQ